MLPPPAELPASTPLVHPDDGVVRARTPVVPLTVPELRVWLRQFGDRFLPASGMDDPEAHRRARLITRFGFLGAFFGTVFATFYLLVEHTWGGVIVALCSLGFLMIPALLRRSGSLSLTGNGLCLLLTGGFTALCCVEGGMYGHAIAWLASVPLCALLLVGRRAAAWWVVVSFGAAVAVIVANLLGADLGPTYDPAWHSLITAAGYLALVVFMFGLGLIFELGRARAFGKLQQALTELKTSHDELERLNQEKNEFLGIAAHDLKNPLTAIIGTADFLRINPRPEQTPRLAANILSAGRRMLDLIKNLLDANAIEEGRFTSNIERCDFRALALECVEQNLSAATRKEITIQIAEGAPVWAKADRAAALQVLDNLLSNAVKYSPSKTTVRVQSGSRGGRTFVSVTDEGPGISAEDRKKMFGKFMRLTAQPTGGESSNGLGLSIVKRLAEAMGGTVECDSELGHGSTFTFKLPAWKE